MVAWSIFLSDRTLHLISSLFNLNYKIDIIDGFGQLRYRHSKFKFNYNLNRMFIDQIAQFEEYLKNNKMIGTLQAFRQQLANKIPQKPSSQLVSLLKPAVQEPQKQQPKQTQNTKKKPQLLADGLLGKIAYSTKIIQDQVVNDRIAKLLDNKIFLKAIGKMFPQTIPRLRQMQGQQDFRDQLQNTAGLHSEDGPSAIYPQQDASILSQPSLVLEQLQKRQSQVDEYTDDNDYGYFQSDFAENELMTGCAKLTQKFGYPDSAVKKGPRSMVPLQKKPTKKFDPEVLFPSGQDKIYPLQYNGIIFDVLKIKLIYDRQRVGFEDKKEIQLQVGTIIMGRYEVLGVMGSGVFARAVKVKDLLSPTQELSCFKVVSNNKDFLDQALDEIKLLRLIKANCDPDAHFILNFKSVVYYKQHLCVQTDLLKDNLFSAYRKNPSFFSVPTIRIIARQILTALATIHSLNIIHSDLKPQNILVKSYSPVQVKVVDLGNSCFVHDNLGTYVQSRSYRAPEVVLGTGYDGKIDIWSVGCIIAELWTKNVLFYNSHLAGMLARMQSILGPWPEWMLESGSQVSNYFSKENLIFFEEDGQYHILIPKKTTLRNRIRTEDPQFLNFIQYLLEVDPDKRPTAHQALNHPFLQ